MLIDNVTGLMFLARVRMNHRIGAALQVQPNQPSSFVNLIDAWKTACRLPTMGYYGMLTDRSRNVKGAGNTGVKKPIAAR